MKTNSLYQRDIVSVKQLSQADVELILATAKTLLAKPHPTLLSHKIIASCFFEPSTRTRLSFETATLRLGGQSIGFASDDSLSVQKGESLHDTIRVINDYADLIVLRHPKEGAAALAADIADVPVINAGDGANQHPTQALIDLFTIQQCQHHIQDLSIALVGDLKHGRTIHSLTQLLAYYNVRLYLIAPDSLALPTGICDELKRNGIRFSFHQNLEDIISKVDIIYMTRIQHERFASSDLKFINNQFTLNATMLEKAKDNLKVMHPLPRVNEIAMDVDTTPYAYYFQQASFGVPVRQALLTLLLNKVLP